MKYLLPIFAIGCLSLLITGCGAGNAESKVIKLMDNKIDLNNKMREVYNKGGPKKEVERKIKKIQRKVKANDTKLEELGNVLTKEQKIKIMRSYHNKMMDSEMKRSRAHMNWLEKNR